MPLTQSNTVASIKPNQGRTWKRIRRIQQVCRLESMFIPDADIAKMLGITVGALHHIKKCVEYQALKIELQTGIISVYSKSMLNNAEAQREKIEELVPMALGAVENILLDRNHPHHAKVALDLMDRNKSTAKITKMEHSIDPALNTHKENQKAYELLKMLGEPEVTPATDAGVNTTKPYNLIVGLPAATNEAEVELARENEAEDDEDDLIGEGPSDIDKLSASNGL